MLGLPHLPDMWRVLKEADLNKIRREAERPFQMLLVAEDVGDAERLSALLSSPEATRHPWLLPADPAEARRAASTRMLDLAVALSPTPNPSPALAFAVDALREAKVPVVMVAFGSQSSTVAVAWPGEAARAAVTALEPSAVAAVAEALLSAVSPGTRLALARHLVPLREPLFAELTPIGKYAEPPPPRFPSPPLGERVRVRGRPNAPLDPHPNPLPGRERERSRSGFRSLRARVGISDWG